MIPEHFILATKAFKEQTHLLEPDDLAVAYACLRAWEDENMGQLFGFFNSGEFSGASQAHRHLQFLPVESMKAQEGGEDWRVLADQLSHSQARLPFITFFSNIAVGSTAAQLHATYTTLYALAVAAVEEYMAREKASGMNLHDASDKAAKISYNLALTSNTMAICPRRAEGRVIEKDTTAGTLGPVALNGTVLAGTLMVKTLEEYDTIRQTPQQLTDVLKVIGFPQAQL